MPRQLMIPKAFQMVASTTTFTASSGTGSATSNLKGTANAIPFCDACSLFLEVVTFTANTSVGGLTLDVFIDSSTDGGTTWYPSVKFAPVTASTSVQRLELRPFGVGISEAASLQNLGATILFTSTGTITNTVIAQDHRVRVNPVGSGATTTFNLFGLAQPFATNAS